MILGVRSYEQLGSDGPAQALQRAMATMSSLVFVGVGDGASDPNIAALRSWLANTFPGSEMRHFRLCLNEEVERLSALHRPEERIVAVGYGDAHADLTGFPGDLVCANAAGGAVTVPADLPAATAGAGVVPPAPVSVGRNDVVALLVGRLLGDPVRPVLVYGAPGIGKTNLTVVGLEQRDVVARFWSATMVRALRVGDQRDGPGRPAALVLGVTSSGDLRPPVLAYLGQAPGLLALDNLETPWESDTLAVEELLGLVAAINGVALITSVRGAELPAGVRWETPIALEPLGLSDARSVFRSIAPERFDTRALDDVLEQMGDVPLAIELLAHAAEGEATPEGLAVRWHSERARLLQRATADHRLLSIGVSIDTSWSSPLMTDPARQLLSVLSWLPDGVAARILRRIRRRRAGGRKPAATPWPCRRSGGACAHATPGAPPRRGCPPASRVGLAACHRPLPAARRDTWRTRGSPGRERRGEEARQRQREHDGGADRRPWQRSRVCGLRARTHANPCGPLQRGRRRRCRRRAATGRATRQRSARAGEHPPRSRRADAGALRSRRGTRSLRTGAWALWPLPSRTPSDRLAGDWRASRPVATAATTSRGLDAPG